MSYRANNTFRIAELLAQMLRIPAKLTWNATTERKLAAHELTVGDAFDVLHEEPQFYAQGAKPEISDSGFYRTRPARLRMVGPTRSDLMLTFILELPDRDGASHIVTGWESSAKEIETYGQDV